MRKPATESEGEGKRKGPLRRLYHWVLSWAERPGGPWALGAIATAESFIFPIPPDALLIPLCIGNPKRAFMFAGICTLGSVLGGMLGYAIGSALFETIGLPILEFYNGGEAFDAIGEKFEENLIVALGSAGFTPIPYKVFTIAAGAFSISFGAFVVISAVSRAARFFLVAALIRVYGEKISDFIERYFNILTIVLAVAVVAGFLVIRPLLH